MVISPEFRVAIDAVHPLTGGKVPIFAADYVVDNYGTGAPPVLSLSLSLSLFLSVCLSVSISLSLSL